MPRKDDNSDNSDVEKDESGSEGEEEYVVEKVVDKRFDKKGNVRWSKFLKSGKIYDPTKIMKFYYRLSICSNGKDMTSHRIHGNLRQIWTVRN
jgi:hypothetical protein